MESVQLVLDVSGGEFASSMLRMQFAALELPPTDELKREECDFMAQEVILAMRRAQRNGWHLGAAIVKLLRARVPPKG